MNKLKALLYNSGPLAPAIAFFLVSLAGFTLSRLTLAGVYFSRISQVDHYWWVLPIGVRMDTVLLCMVLIATVPLLLVLPDRLGRYWKPLLATWFSLWFTVFVYMEVATFPFMAQYDTRPNRLFVEYLIYPKEVFGMLWADYKLALLVGLVAVVVSFRLAWRLSNYWLHNHAGWGFWKRLVVFPVIIVVLFAGGRSSFGHRAANPSTAAFSNDNLVNELGINSTYSLGYAIAGMTDEANSARLYGTMTRDEMLTRVRRQSLIPAAEFTDPEIPTLHHQTPLVTRKRPYNLVIFLQESLGAEYVGALGGKPLTPNLDALSKEGMFLTNLYATGTRSVRGIEATVAGYLPTAGRSVVKLGLSQDHFFTLAQLLRRHGYTSEFIYGGESRFDNMAGFFLSNGFDRVIEESDFDNPVFHGVWGVSDEDLVRRAHKTFVAHGDKPFFALMFSTSNHTPFDYPKGRITPYEEPPNTVNNAIKYADYAIGEFFRLAKTADYFKNTIFVVVADHDTRVYGDALVPVHKFHIPGLIIGPDVPVRHFDKVASQIDLGPTLLDLMGLESDHPMIGRDLLKVPADEPGHAFMQFYKTNAYRVGDQVLIHQAHKDPQQFVYKDGQLVPTNLDPEMARDALAFIQLPATLYKERRYRLPEP